MEAIIKWIQENVEKKPITAIIILLLMIGSTVTSALIAANKNVNATNKEQLTDCYQRMKLCELRYEKLERKTDSIVNVLFHTIQGQKTIIDKINDLQK
jgi:hypothetical protein